MGKITKQWGGLAKEYFTDADNFGIQCKKTFDMLGNLNNNIIPSSFDYCGKYAVHLQYYNVTLYNNDVIMEPTHVCPNNNIIFTNLTI